jgi:hypothetical protein
MKKSTAASLLAAAAGLLAVPATGHAAETVGSDLSHASGNDHTIYCGATPQDTWPCTLVADRIPWTVEAPDDHIITSWSAQLEDGAQARLRLLRRNDDGTYTGAGTSDAVTATRDGVATFKTHIPVPAGDYTIGIDLLEGNVGAIPDPDDDHRIGFTDPPIADGATRTVDTASYELLVGARAETDFDSDGKGDETEDDCVWDCGTGGGGGGGGDAGGGATPESSGGAGSPDTYDLRGPGPRQEEKVPPKGPPFVVDTRGLLRPAKEGRQGWFEVFAANDGSGDLDASFELRQGRRIVGKKQITELESGDDTTVKFRLSAKQRRQLAKKGKVKLALTATAKHEDGTTTPVRQDLTVLAGGAKKYDGSYRGPGPIVFVVQGGAIRTVSSQVNAFCPRTNRHQQLSIFSIDGFPALVKPDGSFAHEGNGGGQALKYNGKLSLKGQSKGYASAYRFELGVGDGGRYFTDGCTGAINWTATRTR